MHIHKKPWTIPENTYMNPNGVWAKYEQTNQGIFKVKYSKFKNIYKSGLHVWKFARQGFDHYPTAF